MPLTRRTNGSLTQNLIGAAWFNDYMDLLTGVMQDQPVKVKSNISLDTIGAIGLQPGAPTATLITSSGNLGVGVYKYAVTYVSGDGGETIGGNQASVTTTSTQKQVSLTAIPTGPAGTAKRNIYRTTVGGGQFNLLTTLNDNTTTTFTDNVADGSLNSNIQANVLVNTFGGTLMLKGDGGISFNAVALQGEQPNMLWMGARTGGANPDLFIQNQGTGIIVIQTRQQRINLRNSSGSQWGELTASGNIFVIKNPVSNGPVGIRNGNGRLAEARGDGSFVISGSNYNTGGIGFDGFDLAESYAVPVEYEPGTIVCPDGAYDLPYPPENTDAYTPHMIQCTHDACNLAMPISYAPGFTLGYWNYPSSPWYDNTRGIFQQMALTGRLFVKTSETSIPYGSYVCSNGAGGVRIVATGEKVMAIGVTFGPVQDGRVPIQLRYGQVSL